MVMQLVQSHCELVQGKSENVSSSHGNTKIFN